MIHDVFARRGAVVGALIGLGIVLASLLLVEVLMK